MYITVFLTDGEFFVVVNEFDSCGGQALSAHAQCGFSEQAAGRVNRLRQGQASVHYTHVIIAVAEDQIT